MTPQLKKTITRKPKRIGRGYGSGKGGHTAGRGQKGQKSRTNLHILFQGTKVKKSLLKRLPLQRGKGRNKSFKSKPIIINLEALTLLKASTITTETLVKAGIVVRKDASSYGVKILGKGEVDKAYTIKVPISGSAAKKITKAGGKIS